MFDAFARPSPIPATAPVHQRARGDARVALVRRAGRTRLDRLHQSGSAKAFLPRVHRAMPEVVFLNTAGGITGGDRMAFGLAAGAGVAVTGTTQTAERAYASTGAAGRMDVALTAGPGATLAWLPQETILYEHSRLDRHTRAELAGDARLILSEMVVLGRHAMGERPTDLMLRDRREVIRDGRPVLLDPVCIDAGVLAEADAPALLGGARAFAAIVLVAADAARALAPLRRVLAASDAVRAGASAWDGKLVVRALAEHAQALRLLVARALEVVTGAALPRVWQI